jgi:hypothetical protein
MGWRMGLCETGERGTTGGLESNALALRRVGVGMSSSSESHDSFGVGIAGQAIMTRVSCTSSIISVSGFSDMYMSPFLSSNTRPLQ